jgi:hypothetical protein
MDFFLGSATLAFVPADFCSLDGLDMPDTADNPGNAADPRVDGAKSEMSGKSSSELAWTAQSSSESFIMMISDCVLLSERGGFDGPSSTAAGRGAELDMGSQGAAAVWADFGG